MVPGSFRPNAGDSLAPCPTCREWQAINQKSADKPDSTTSRKAKSLSLSRGSVRSLTPPPRALEMILEFPSESSCIHSRSWLLILTCPLPFLEPQPLGIQACSPHSLLIAYFLALVLKEQLLGKEFLLGQVALTSHLTWAIWIAGRWVLGETAT